jgi:hypothetical protein
MIKDELQHLLKDEGYVLAALKGLLCYLETRMLVNLNLLQTAAILRCNEV